MIFFNEYNNDLFPSLITLLKIKYFNEINAENQSIINVVHNFLLKCVEKFNRFIFKDKTTSKCCNKKCDTYNYILTKDCGECYVCQGCSILMNSRVNQMSKTICLACKHEITVWKDSTNGYTIFKPLRDNPDKKSFNETFMEKLNSFYLNMIEFLFKNEWQRSNRNLFEPVLEAVCEGKISNQEETVQITKYYRLCLLEFFYKNHLDFMLKHLESWFRNRCRLNFNDAVQMAILFENCVEEICHENDELKNTSLESKARVSFEISQALVKEKNTLKQIYSQDQKEYSSKEIIYLAKLKFCLKMLAKFNCSDDVVDKLANDLHCQKFNSNIKTLLELPECHNKNKTIFEFIVKEIIRKYGSSQFKAISNNDQLNWIVPKEFFGNNFTVSDKYLLMGPAYIALKQILTSCLQDNNGSALENYFIANKNLSFVFVAIALYKCITFMFKTNPDMAVNNIFESVLNKHFPREKQWWQPLLENTLMHNLKINEENAKKFDINALLIQLKYSIMLSTSRPIKTLASLINNPLEYKDSFLPAMPQDSVFDTQKAISESGRGNENPTWYACPNDHMYALFDCGRPWVVTKCKTPGCNADIGGTNHNLLPGNKKVTLKDTSLKGYCLPDAAALPEDPLPERTLSAHAFATLKFVIHSCLYFACETREREVSSIMEYNVLPDKKKFFWDHLNKDIRILSKALNINAEDACILLHLVCNQILSNTRANTNDVKWDTKENRSKWEEYFQQIIDPIFKNSANELTKSQEALKSVNKDDEQSQEIYFMAYEINISKKNDGFPSNVYDDQNLWKYKPQVNLNILNTEMKFHTKNDEYTFLKKFVELEAHIKILRNVPDIIEFLNHLQTFYHKDLFKHQASHFSMRQMIAKKTLPKSKPCFLFVFKVKI